MNASIRGIIDHMFKDTVDNSETRALHEELLNNCLEHYNDLIGRGMSETEAIDAVVESLKGMKEVIDEYPKKNGAEKEEQSKAQTNETIPEIHAEETSEKPVKEEKPSEYIYDPALVRKLKTDMKNCDLKIGVSADQQIHVRCEDMNQIQCEINEGVLSVRIVDNTRKSIDAASQEINSQEFSVKGLLSFIGKAIGSVASSISVSWNVYIDLPPVSISEMDLNAKSGDIDVKAKMPEILNAHNMSGDVEVESIDRDPAQKVILSAMSGEVGFKGNAEKITLSSMSGDVEAHGAFGTAELKSTSGDVELNGEAEQIRMNSVSGDVTVELRSNKARSIQARSTSGDVDINLSSGTDSIHADLSTVSGSARCSVQDGGPGAKLQIQAGSVSGDVTIK